MSCINVSQLCSRNEHLCGFEMRACWWKLIVQLDKEEEVQRNANWGVQTNLLASCDEEKVGNW